MFTKKSPPRLAALCLATGALLACADDTSSDTSTSTEETGDGDGDPTGDGDGDGDPTGDGDGDPSGDGDGDPTGDGDGDGDPTGDGDGDGDGDPSGDGDGDGDLCGNGNLDDGEGCDNGDANADDAECTSSCQLATCGDGLILAGVEDCDDVGESATCDVDCTAVVCGDNTLNVSAGEACDDGNMLDTDACVGECAVAACGDGFVYAGVEECDDGKNDDGNGCSAICGYEFEIEGKIFLTSSNNDVGFWVYDIAGNFWDDEVANPPTTTRSQITNDGNNVYLMGVDNTVYAYEIGSNSWSSLMPGPGAPLTSSPIGYFQAFDGGFYYLKDGQSTMYVHRDGAWSSFDLGGPGSCAGTWDSEHDELYIRTMEQLGFKVVDTTNDTVVRTIVDAASVGENSRTGSYANGYFYSRVWSGPFQRFDRIDGTKTNTGATPLSGHTASDTDFTTGKIYVSGYGADGTSFQVFDPSDNSVTTLANQPNVSNHSTITVVRPAG